MSKRLQILSATPFTITYNGHKRTGQLPIKGIRQDDISRLVANDFIDASKGRGDVKGKHEVFYELTSAGANYMNKLQKELTK